MQHLQPPPVPRPLHLVAYLHCPAYMSRPKDAGHLACACDSARWLSRAGVLRVYMWCRACPSRARVSVMTQGSQKSSTKHGHRREKVPCNLTFEARGWRWTSETSLSAKRETVGYKHDGDSLTLEGMRVEGVRVKGIRVEGVRVEGMRVERARWGDKIAIRTQTQSLMHQGKPKLPTDANVAKRR
ncbi:hypothetical protein BJV77DRAFT_964922 [Russula vinacea]|nr:hypothetical protein BJV77DRAFT_964922 [Russula vinacea]